MLFKKVGMLDPDGKHNNPFTGKPYSKMFSHIAENGAPNLKVFKPKAGWRYMKTYVDRNIIFKKFINYQATICVLGTGVGKTVVIPKLLSHYFDYKTPVIVTIPTIAAANSSHVYASSCLDVRQGFEVALKTGDFDLEYSPNETKVLYSTEGYVSNMITSDEMLSKYGGICIDEAHTRGVDIDILLSKVANIANHRPEFRIIIMSATIDPKEWIEFFNKANITNTLYQVEGIASKHPITHVYNNIELKKDDLQGEKMINEIDELLKKKETGNILAFVTMGSTAIKNRKTLQARIDKSPKLYHSIPFISVLEGKTDPKLRELILGEKPVSDIPPGKYGPYTRKVTFATNAVEFSVTFEDGLDYVIESGLFWNVYYDYQLNCNVMEASMIAHSNIKQRCGRAGRTAPGICLKMYTKAKYDSLDEFGKPDILRSSGLDDKILSTMTLQIANNYTKCNNFLDNMITPIPQTTKDFIFKKLLQHNLLNFKGVLTPLAKLVTNVKIGYLDYCYKKMYIASYYFDCMEEIIIILSILDNINGQMKNLISVDKNVFSTSSDENEIINKVLHNFKDDSGDFMTLYNIYVGTLYYMNDIKKRREFCKENYINYKTVENIDKTYWSIKNDFDGTLKSEIKLIMLLNLFNVENSKKHKQEYQYIRLEYLKNPMQFKELKGGSDASLIKKKSNPKQFSKKKSKANSKQFSKKKSKGKKWSNWKNKNYSKKRKSKGNFKQFSKKKKKQWKPKKIKSHVKKAIENIKSYKKPTTKIPDFIEAYAKQKQNNKNINKVEDKQKVNYDNVSVVKLKKNSKPKQNMIFAKKVNSRLNKINFKTFKPGHPINLSKNKTDNILACIFYGFCTNVAVNIEKDIFQVKDTPYIEVNLGASATSTLKNTKKIPKMIVFTQLSKIQGNYSFGFTNRLSIDILNMFGIDYKHPQK